MRHCVIAEAANQGLAGSSVNHSLHESLPNSLYCAAVHLAIRNQRIDDLAAVVNDDIISELDVYMRLRMAMLSARLEDTEETRQRLLPQVLRNLIDDRLKMQEAKRLLETTFLTVKEVAHHVGLGDESHFVRDFKRLYGHSPGQHRTTLGLIVALVGSGLPW